MILHEHFGVNEYSNRRATVSSERSGFVTKYYEDNTYLGCHFYNSERDAENRAEEFALGYLPHIVYDPDLHQGGVESFA